MSQEGPSTDRWKIEGQIKDDRIKMARLSKKVNGMLMWSENVAGVTQ